MTTKHSNKFLSVTWIHSQLKKHTHVRWTPRAKWSNYTLDLWCAKLYCAIQVNESEDDALWDETNPQDEYLFRRSGIVTFRTWSHDFERMQVLLTFIRALDDGNVRRQRLGITKSGSPFEKHPHSRRVFGEYMRHGVPPGLVQGTLFDNFE